MFQVLRWSLNQVKFYVYHLFLACSDVCSVKENLDTVLWVSSWVACLGVLLESRIWHGEELDSLMCVWWMHRMSLSVSSNSHLGTVLMICISSFSPKPGESISPAFEGKTEFWENISMLRCSWGFFSVIGSHHSLEWATCHVCQSVSRGSQDCVWLTNTLEN